MTASPVWPSVPTAVYAWYEAQCLIGQPRQDLSDPELNIFDFMAQPPTLFE